MKLRGKVWTGYCGECKHDKRTPCYIIKRKGGNGYFLCDLLRPFRYKKVEVTVKEIR